MPSWKKLIISGSDAAIPSVSTAADFTIDAGGDIILDADGTDIVLKDGGTSFGSFKRASSDFIIKAETQDKDILLKGNDGGATITALQLDMSEGGNAQFLKNISGSQIEASGDVIIQPTNKLYLDGGSHTYIHEQADDILEIVVGGEIQLKLTEAGNGVEIPVDAHPLKIGAGSDLQFSHNGTNSFIDNYTGNLNITNNTDDGDIILKSDDGSGGTTAYLTLDGSATSVNIDQDVKLAATKKLFLDGGGNSYIQEESADNLIFRAAGGNYLRVTGTNIVLNDPGASYDVRIEGDTDSNLGFFDGSADKVGIGTNSPKTKLHVAGTISGSQIESSGDVIAYSTSDRKFKDNIQPISEPLYKLSKVGGYTFDWNEKQDTYEGHDIGVIAQEIQEVLPEVVTERENGLAVKYEKIVPLLIESIKELKQEVDEIKQKCDCLNK